jgi:UDPglucose 6-dehydrogenase
MNITVFGLGFVGLTTALGFADKGNTVYGVEANKSRADALRNGVVPFEEPHLGEALRRHNNEGFSVTEDIEKAVRESDCVFYCVGTPCDESGNADLDCLYSAIDETLKYADDGKFRLLTVKSTIPPSTTKDKIIPYAESKGFVMGENIGVANNPEFLREGHCWEDFMNADRIVFGVCDEKSERVLEELYAPFAKPIFAVTPSTGEFIKYLSNTLLATLISYSNEMANAAHTIGDVDIPQAFKILHLDGRWSGGDGKPCKMTDYVYPGCGYGGYCLPKDTNAFYSLMKGLGFEARILENVIRVNDGMPSAAAERITRNLDKTETIGILGLSFKPESDDVRESPSAKIIAEILKKGYRNIIAYDPFAEQKFKESYGLPVSYADSVPEVVEKSGVLAVVTAWNEFRNITAITQKPVVDCRYMLQPELF